VTGAARGAPLRRWAPLIAGGALVVGGSIAGLQPDVADAVVGGPIVVRAALTALAALLGAWLLVLAVGTLAGDGNGEPEATPRSFATMIRGIRLAFLAIAAFAAGSAFLVGNLLPLIVGLIIAGIDVAETALLLLVAGAHHGDDAAD
jgi:hypothetical protein